MKSTELRIGNYLQDAKGKLAPVEGLSKNKIKAYSGMVTEMPLKPIPLTEEWLLRFGFKKVRFEKYAHEKLSKFRAYPHVMKQGFGIYLMGSYTLPHVKHVHQLQNLYFALTGEELTLNK